MSANLQEQIVTRPILFSGPMVRALLDGRKTQTRRIVKPQPPDHAIEVFDWRAPDIAESVKANEGCYYNDMDGLHFHCKCPYGTIGDRIWVRETWGKSCDADANGLVVYQADRTAYHMLCENDGEGDPVDHGWKHYEPIVVPKWKPSIHMPRWASRIALEITGVRIERVNEISEEDAVREGVQCAGVPASLTNRGAFAKLWESINGAGSWKQNPWVWVVEFKVV